MEAEDLVFLSGTLLHVLLTAALMAYFRLQVSSHVFTEKKAKAVYSWLCLCIGISAGIGIVGMLDFLDILIGPCGVILVTATLANLILACMLIVIGRIVIGWVPMRW
jgi:hypothetical protein